MLHLWCANKLGNCPPVALERFRFTCLGCRWRRRYYGTFTEPPFWIDYTLKSDFTVQHVDHVVIDGVKYFHSGGGKLECTSYKTLHIDPRGHFTSLRVAAIKVLDVIMLKTGVRKPLHEFAEFLSSYPTV